MEALIFGADDVGGLHGLAAPAAEGGVAAGFFLPAVVEAAAGLLAVDDALDAFFHDFLEGADAGHAVGFADGVDADGLGVDGGGAVGGDFGGYALVAGFGAEVADGFSGGFAVFFGGGGFAVGEEGGKPPAPCTICWLVGKRGVFQ